MVAAAAAGKLPDWAFVDDDGGGGTFTSGLMFLPPAQLAVSHLCGLAAEWFGGNASPWDNARTDMARVHQLAVDVVGERGSRSMHAEFMALDAALEFVQGGAAWGAIEEIAMLLSFSGKLDQSTLRRVLDPTRRPLPQLPTPAWERSLRSPAEEILIRDHRPQLSVAVSADASILAVAPTMAHNAILPLAPIYDTPPANSPAKEREKRIQVVAVLVGGACLFFSFALLATGLRDVSRQRHEAEAEAVRRHVPVVEAQLGDTHAGAVKGRAGK